MLARIPSWKGVYELNRPKQKQHMSHAPTLTTGLEA